MFALRKLMKSWNGHQPDFVKGSKVSGYREDGFLMLERQVVAHYVDTFFLYFGQAPALPRNLRHVPMVPYISESRQQVATSQQGIYLDISEWE